MFGELKVAASNQGKWAFNGRFWHTEKQVDCITDNFCIDWQLLLISDLPILLRHGRTFVYIVHTSVL